MSRRRLFRMSVKEADWICRGNRLQSDVNRFWFTLAQKYGFSILSVQPCWPADKAHTIEDGWFLAEPTE